MPEPINIDNQGNIVLKINVKRFFKVFVIMSLAIGSGFLPIDALQQNEAARICMMIFVGAAGLWVTETIPPFATAILVIVLNVYLLGRPDGPLGLEAKGIETSWRIFLNPIASPVLVLFFGGFIMAIGAAKHGLDIRMARAFLKPFGTRPSMVLLGIISITALFSMFISNTATTAMMFAILTPIFTSIEERDQFKKALALAVPFAANIGGMGTIIGTPPNAVAASVLAGLGPDFEINFLEWMIIGVPLAGVMLAVLWVVLLRMFRPRTKKFEVLFPEHVEITWDLLVVMITFTVTVLMWLTEPLHKIPAAVVAMLPVMVFTTFGIIDRTDLKRIDWDVIILVAGGLTLGVAMNRTGLSEIIVGLVNFSALNVIALLVVIGFFTVAISNFMSHTAASNLLIPIVVAITASIEGIGPMLVAVVVALCSSMAMSLPISTPPNAIAFSTRMVETRDMARAGTLVSLIGVTAVLAYLILFGNALGLGVG
jgi:sodium-dependent dicarboxylate transporter 2/3/5